jgi:hypothetical protein
VTLLWVTSHIPGFPRQRPPKVASRRNSLEGFATVPFLIGLTLVLAGTIGAYLHLQGRHQLKVGQELVA